jgi:putative membrane protein
MRIFKNGLYAAVALTLVVACGGDRNRQAQQPATSETRTTSESRWSEQIDQSQAQQNQGQVTPTPGTTDPSAISGGGMDTGLGGTTDTTGMGGDQGSVSQGSMDTGSGTSTAGATGDTKAKTERALNDAEIFAVANAVHEGEIQMAEVARKSASSAQVKQYAQLMITDHKKAHTKAKTLAQKAKITASDNEVSNQLKSDVQTMMIDMKDLKGRELDRMYMQNQVKAHRTVLDLVDTRLLPNVSNAEMKSHLQEVRTKVSDHLTQAESISTKLDQQPVGAAGAKSGAPGKSDTDTTKKAKDTDKSKDQPAEPKY